MAKFAPGQSGNPHGKPKGTPNCATVEGRELAQRLVNSAEYRRQLRRRLLAGDLPPAVEVLLLHYAWGKPRDVLELHQPDVSWEGATASLREKLSHLLADKLAHLPVDCPNCAARAVVPTGAGTDAPPAPARTREVHAPVPDEHAPTREEHAPVPASGVELLDDDEPVAPAPAPIPSPAPSAPADREELDGYTPAPSLAERLARARPPVRLWTNR
jgi:hypothetical protein